MNMTTTVGEHQFGNGDHLGGNMFIGTYGFFAHPMSMKAIVGQRLLGNGDRW